MMLKMIMLKRMIGARRRIKGGKQDEQEEEEDLERMITIRGEGGEGDEMRNRRGGKGYEEKETRGRRGGEGEEKKERRR